MEAGDDALLAAWSAGDTSAGEELYRRFFPVLYRFFSNKLGDDIDDLIQATFLACTTHRERIRSGGSFRAFILVVARNEFFNHLQRRYRLGNTVDASTVSLAAIGASPSQLLALRDEQRLLLLALRKLPLDVQDLLELHYFEKLSGPELAVVFAVPEGTIRSRLRRAIEKLRHEIDRLAATPQEAESSMASLSQWAAEIRAISEGLDP